MPSIAKPEFILPGCEISGSKQPQSNGALKLQQTQSFHAQTS